MLTRCDWCGGDAIPGTTCPKSIACPTCGAAPGAACRRPSGHRSDTMHAARWQETERRDAEIPEAQELLFDLAPSGLLF